MEIIARNGQLEDLKVRVEKSKATSKRGSYIEYFVQALNEEREKQKLPKWDVKLLAIKLSHVHTDDLYPFFQDCVKAKGGFNKAFWGKLKVKK